LNGLQDFLNLPYGELEQLNLEAKEQRLSHVPADEIREKRLKYLTDEKRIKAITLSSATWKAASTCWTMTKSGSSKAGTT
jgi:hypothetical protein